MAEQDRPAPRDVRVNLAHYSARGFLLYSLCAAGFVAAYAFSRPEFQTLLPPGELFSLASVRIILAFGGAALGLAVAGAGNPALGRAVCAGLAVDLAIGAHQTCAVLASDMPAAAGRMYANLSAPAGVPVALAVLLVAIWPASAWKDTPRWKVGAVTAACVVMGLLLYLTLSRMLIGMSTTPGRTGFFALGTILILVHFAAAAYFGMRHWYLPTGFSGGVAMCLSVGFISSLYTLVRGPDSPGATFEVVLLNLLALAAVPYGFILDGIQAISNTKMHDSARSDPAQVDALTGLLNRRALDTLGKSHFEDMQRAGRPVSVLMIDLDHFKLLNDNYGHQAGDLVLQKFGEILRGSVRGTDLVARYGGEEFIVVLPGAPLAPALRLGERIRETTAGQVFHHANKELRVTISVGAATAFPGEITDFNALIALGDKNLYRAKREGRNRVLSSPIE